MKKMNIHRKDAKHAKSYKTLIFITGKQCPISLKKDSCNDCIQYCNAETIKGP